MSALAMKITLDLDQILEAVKLYILRQQSISLMDFKLVGAPPTLSAHGQCRIGTCELDQAVREYVDRQTGMVSSEIEWQPVSYSWACLVTVAKPSPDLRASVPLCETHAEGSHTEAQGHREELIGENLPDPDNFPSP